MEEDLARLAAIVESSEDAIVGKTMDGTITSWNPGAERLYGYAAAEAVGQPFAIVVPPERLEELREITAKLSRGERVEHFDTVRLRKDGTRIDVSLSVSPIKDASGRVVGAATIARGIGERVAAEKALRESEERFRTLARTAPVGIFQTDARGDCLYVNERWRRIAGMSAEEAAGKGWVAAIHPADRERVRAEWYGAVAAEKDFSREYRFLSPSGVVTWVLGRGTAQRNGEGRTVGYIGTLEDITERKRAEAERERLLAEVRRAAAEMEATFNSMAHGVIIYGSEGAGHILRLNPAAQRMLGYDEAELALPVAERWQRRCVTTADGRPFPAASIPALRALRGEEVRDEVVVFHRGSEARYLSISAAPIRDPDGKLLGAVSTFSDITEEHELEEQREDFIRTISHDLRQPLTIISGMAQWLKGRLTQAGLTREAQTADRVLASARRMASMIRDLVDSARLEADALGMHPQPVDLPRLVRDLLPQLGAPAAQARVHLEAADGLAPVLADPEKIERALVNLISNALKYSAADKPVVVRVRERDGEAVVSVIDQGVGIPKEDIPRVFERYYRAKPEQKREGLGLGLYITRLLVEAQGGRIWVESQQGEGSAFSFTLPLA